MTNLYSKKHLMQILKKEGLPYSSPTLISFEKSGLIKKPAGSIVFEDREWRVYNQMEIDEIVRAIRVYKKGI